MRLTMTPAQVRLALPVPHDAVGVGEAIQLAQVVHDAAPYAKSLALLAGGRLVSGVPPTSHLLAFTITAFLLILVPGPSVLFVVSRSIALGRATGIATVAGNTIGAFCQVVAVAIGIGPLVERSVLLFTVLKLAGAAYLVFLGVQAIRHRRSLAEALGAKVERKTVARLCWTASWLASPTPR